VPENLRTLRRKREIVGEIRQITRAMKLVSAAKLKRTTNWRTAAHSYFDELRETLALVVPQVGEGFSHPYLRVREVRRIGLLVVAGDKGLCGAFNANVIAQARRFARRSRARVELITVGTRTGEMARRARLNVVRQFPAIHERERGADVQDIAHYLLAAYDQGEHDEVRVCYARFVSRISSEPAVERVLPVPVPEPPTEAEQQILEPSPEELVAAILPKYVAARIFDMLLSSAAAEHSARVMAMTAATDNADDMIEQLTRQINRKRQADITRELLDVVTGADALSQQ